MWVRHACSCSLDTGKGKAPWEEEESEADDERYLLMNAAFLPILEIASVDLLFEFIYG